MKKRLAWLGVTLLVALTATAVAVAAHEALTTKAVSATFTATPSAKNKTTTCKGADGDYTRIQGEYSGTSTSSEPRLAGAITIKGDSLVNKTTGLGSMKGTVRINTASDEDTKANFTAVISGGQLSGFLNGRVHDASGSLLGGLSAAFGATGITSGSIGATSPAPALIVAGSCDKGKAKGKDDKDKNGKQKGHDKKHH
jgi:hypothetical protein